MLLKILSRCIEVYILFNISVIYTHHFSSMILESTKRVTQEMFHFVITFSNIYYMNEIYEFIFRQ